MELKKEIVNEYFTKHHLEGLPFPGAFHVFTGHGDKDIHDHPWDFQTFILKGGYIERIYMIDVNGNWGQYEVHRKPGTSHYMQAETIHEIVQLPEGECVTLIIPGPIRRNFHLWRFEANAIYHRPWHDADFQPYKP